MTLSGFDLCRASMAVTDVTAPEQSVLLTLAVMANDDAQCWPGIAKLVSLTKLSERTIQRAVQALKDASHISWVDKPGRGRIYVVHPRHSGTPSEETPVTVAPATLTPRQPDTPVTLTPTPVTVAPKQPITTITQKTSSSSRARAKCGTQVPADFWPNVKDGSATAKAMADWPPGRVAETVEHFIDHHTAKQTLSADWQASFRTWIKLDKRYGNRQPANFNGNGSSRNRTAALSFLDLGTREEDRPEAQALRRIGFG